MAATITYPWSDGAARLAFAFRSLAEAVGHAAEIAGLVHFAATARRAPCRYSIESPNHAFS